MPPGGPVLPLFPFICLMRFFKPFGYLTEKYNFVREAVVLPWLSSLEILCTLAVFIPSQNLLTP